MMPPILSFLRGSTLATCTYSCSSVVMSIIDPETNVK